MSRIVTAFFFLVFLAGYGWGQTARYEQLTNLPTFFIETADLHPIGSKEHYLSGRLVIVDQGAVSVYDSIQIRGRGNSTWRMAEKKPYRLKFAKPLPLLGDGYAQSSDWTLLANHGDKTLIRNALTRELGLFVGLPFCPAAMFIDLYVNGDYVGNYQVSDQVQAGRGRIPVDKKTGWLLETSGKWNLERNHFTTAEGLTYNIMNPKTKNLSETKVNEIRLWMEKMESAVFSEHFADSVFGYRAFIDDKSLVDWYVASEITGNLDALLSVYMYKEDGDNHLKFGPMWDMDFAYGRSGEASLEKEMEAFVDFHDRPFQRVIQRMWQDPWFARACHERLEALVSAGLADYLDQRIDSLCALIALSHQQNFCRWSVSQPIYSWEKPVYYNSYQPYVRDLKRFLAIHIPYLRKRFKELAVKQQ